MVTYKISSEIFSNSQREAYPFLLKPRGVEHWRFRRSVFRVGTAFAVDCADPTNWTCQRAGASGAGDHHLFSGLVGGGGAGRF